MLIRLLGAVFALLLLGVRPASAHVVSADADLQLAQTIAGVELTTVLRRTPQVPGPLHVDLIAYQPVRDLTIELAVDDSTGTVRLRQDQAGTYSAVLEVREVGPHELHLAASGESSALPFTVRVPQPATWELVVYGGFGATGLTFAAAVLAGARGRRGTGAALGACGVVAVVVATTVAVMSPQLVDRTADPGRPYVQAYVSAVPERPVVGEDFTLRFDLVDGSTGLPADDLAVHHSAFAHLVVTSQDGGYFRHVHPRRTARGRWEARLGADRPGRYRAYVEFERTDAGGQLVSGTFDVGGDPPAEPTAVITRTFPVGRPVTVELDTGSAALQPWLGMAGHLIVREGDGDHLGHVHEQSPAVTSDGTAAAYGPTLRFTLAFPRPGRYFAWIQYVEDYRIVTVPEVIEVVP